jgi:hypothetical protein
MKLVSRDCARALSSVEYKNRQLASESLPVSEEAPLFERELQGSENPFNPCHPW